jgi:hypothetical protein
MKTRSHQFSQPRFRHLLLLELHRSRRVLTATLAAAVVALPIYLLQTRGTDPVRPLYVEMFAIFLLIGGWLFSASIFRDIHREREGAQYLTLPVSNLERFLSRYLISGPLFYGFAVLSYLLYEIAAGSISVALGGVRSPLFDPLSPLVIQISVLFFMIHAFSLLGEMHFSRYAQIKTPLWIAAVLLLIAAVAFLALRIFYWNYFDSLRALEPYMAIRGHINPWPEQRSFLHYLLPLAVYLWVLYLSYLALQDKELQAR